MAQNPDDVIDDFTGGAPRAPEWRAMRLALSDRLLDARRRLSEADPDSQAALSRQIRALERQIQTLETEEVVAQFVEDSIKASLARAPADTEADEQ